MSSREWAIASSESIGIELVCSLDATGAPISSGGLFVQGAQKVQRVLLGSLDRIVAACDPGWRLINGPTIRTKVSHGTGELSKALEGAIARQLKVRTTFFRGMMDCHNSYEDYCQKVCAMPFSPGS